MFIHLLTFLLMINLSNESIVKKFIQPKQCTGTTYFNTLTLSCESCSGFFSSSSSKLIANHSRKFLQSLPDKRTDCVCSDGYRTVIRNGQLECIPLPECKNGQSLIQGYCGYCPVDGCDCPDGKILRKNHETNHFYCADCRPFDDSVCQSCHISFYMFNDDHSCHCPESTHLIEDGICLDRNSIISYKMLNSYSTVTFKENRFKSKFLFDSLRPASKWFEILF